MVAEFTVMVGVGSTVILYTAVLEHPTVLVPVTEYVVLTEGDTTIELPVLLEGSQV